MIGKLLIVVVVVLLLVGGAVYNYLEEEHRDEINKERQDYNSLVEEHFRTLKLGERLIPIKPMKT